MTHEDWEFATDPRKMLWAIRPSIFDRGIADRKLRLLAVAFCRRISHLLANIEAIRPIEIAEKFADGKLTVATLSEWYRNAPLTTSLMGGAPHAWTPQQFALAAMGDVVHPDAYQAADGTMWLAQDALHPDASRLCSPEHVIQANIVRDAVPIPFTPDVIRAEWVSDAVIQLAQDMYISRDFATMPTLAKLLEATGCDSSTILNHCRATSQHVRGCWVVDAVLGRQ